MRRFLSGSHPVPLGLAVASAAILAVAGCDSGPTADDFVGECTEALTLPSLAVGEGIRLAGNDARIVCPASADGSGNEYVLVVHQAGGSPADSVVLRVTADGIRPPGSEPTLGGAVAAQAAGGLPHLALDGRGHAPGGADGHVRDHDPTWPEMDQEQHLQLRELERRELTPLVRPGLGATSGTASGAASGTASGAASGATSGTDALQAGPAQSPFPTTPAVGDLVEINAQSQNACASPLYRTGEVMAVTNRAIVVADTLNPSAGFSLQDYEHLAASFDTLVAPLAEGAFGTGSDVSGDGRTILFYTQEVNRLTAVGANTIVLGFFFARDLFPKSGTSGLSACAHSNVAEILYLLVPDPDGTINQNKRAFDFVDRRAVATLIHEYQHLLNAGRRLHVVQTPEFQEDAWLNEGLSHIAEEILFYRASGKAEGQNITIDEIRSDAQVLEAMNRHQLTNAFRLRRFLESPSTNSPLDNQVGLATRGAAWHFLRYTLDRRGGSGNGFLRSLVEGPSTGTQNLAVAMGGTPTLQDWMADWSVALYTDSRVQGIPDRYRDRSWNHVSIFRHLDEQDGHTNPPYPLLTRGLSDGGSLTQVVKGGGSAYFRFGLVPGAGARILLTSGGGAPPASLRATLLRVR